MAIAARAWDRHGVCLGCLGTGIAQGQFCGFSWGPFDDAGLGDFAGIGFLCLGRRFGHATTVARFPAIGPVGRIATKGV